MNQVVALLLLLAEFLKKLVRAKEQKDHEAEVIAIDRDPGAWFNMRYGRVHKPADVSGATDTANTPDSNPPANVLELPTRKK